MDISATSSSMRSNSDLMLRHSAGAVAPNDNKAGEHKVERQRQHGCRSCHGNGIQVFRQELRMSLRAQFHTELKLNQGAYSTNQARPTSDDVADEALAVAKNVVAQSPTTAETSLTKFRASVEQSVKVASKTVATSEDAAEIGKSVDKIDSGIAKIEESVAKTKEASSSVLEVNSRTKNRSTIKIRTQEGDVVKLSLKKVDSMSASNTESVNGDSSTSETVLKLSSRSQMMVKVRGDLSEAELGAIEGILGHAQEIADAFFGGDMRSAFESVSGFEFDSDQIARVNMRFRMQSYTQVSYAQSSTLAPAMSKPVSEPAMTADTPAPAIAAETPAPAVAAEPDVPAVAENPSAESSAPANPVVAIDALQGFFEMVGSFLRGVSEGFEGVSGSATLRYHHSESFKLSLLQSVINTLAPDESENAAANAVEALEQIKGDESE